MIITDKFVFIHLPKTGGTFVEEVLEKIHRGRGDSIVEACWDKSQRKEGLLKRMRRSLADLMERRSGTFIKLLHKRGGAFTPHGVVSQIPPRHRGKPILTVLRNPYDRYVSQFEFKWWVKSPPPPERMAVYKSAFPNYPDLSFEDFINLSNRYFREPVGHFPPDDQLGRHTTQFAEFYFKDQARMEAMDEAYMRDGGYRQDLHEALRPIFQEDLNRQLHDFLLEMDYKPDEIAFILNHDPIHPPGSTRSRSQKWEQYYTPALKADVRRRERMLFALYPQWDV